MSPARKRPDHATSGERRRRSLPLLSSVRRVGGRMVLLPRAERHRRRWWSRAIWIAAAVLVAGLAAFALDGGPLIDSERPHDEAATERIGPPRLGPGSLAFPPTGEDPLPPPR